MINWLQRIITSRFLKTAIRYQIAILIGVLGTQLPWPAPVVELGAYLQAALAEWLSVNQEQLVELLAGALSAILIGWSVQKNRANAKVEKEVASLGLRKRVK